MSQVVVTISESPDDVPTFFNIFADILIKQTMWSEGTKMEIMELGPRDKLQSKFKLLPSSGYEFTFTVVFDISSDKINVLYEYNLEFLLKMPMMKLMEKMARKTLSPQISSLVHKSVNEAIKKMKEDISSEVIKPTSSDDPLKILKIKFVNGEISEEEYLHKKKILED
jgi:hypothetical protein